MPDVVDPVRACGLGIFGGVDARGGEFLLEDWVAETEVGADAAVKGVVAGGDVVVAPAELPGVGCEDANVKAGFVGSGEERYCKFVVVGHVELVEAGALTVGFGDCFDRVGASGRETVREIQFLGDGSDGDFAGWVIDLVNADRGETDRGRHFMAEDSGRGVTEISIDELPGDDTVAEEGLSIGEVGIGLTGIGGSIIPGYALSRQV